MPLVVFAHLAQILLMLHPDALHFRALCLLLLVWLGVPAVRAFPDTIKACPFQPRQPMPRCCTRIQDEFAPSYASVLVHGHDPASLEQAVRDIETKQRVTSCFTAWCSRCAGPYLLTTDLDAFPAPSAHHTHQLLLLSVLRESGAFFPSEPV
jgi:hypothetical protein